MVFELTTIFGMFRLRPGEIEQLTQFAAELSSLVLAVWGFKIVAAHPDFC